MIVRIAIALLSISVTGCFSGELDLDPLPKGIEGCYVGPGFDKFKISGNVASRIDDTFLFELEGTYKGKGDRVFLINREIFYLTSKDKIVHGRRIGKFLRYRFENGVYRITLLDVDTAKEVEFYQVRGLEFCR